MACGLIRSEQLGLLVTTAVALLHASGSGCTGEAFSTSDACCNHLALNGGVNATSGGLCAAAASSLSCYVADEAKGTCTETTGKAMCTAAGPMMSFSESAACCNRLVQLGVNPKDLQGACEAAAAESPKCYIPNLTAGTCDGEVDAARCDSLWLAQAQRSSANGTVFDSQQLCCTAVAAAIGDAKTAGACKVTTAGCRRMCLATWQAPPTHPQSPSRGLNSRGAAAGHRNHGQRHHHH